MYLTDTKNLLRGYQGASDFRADSGHDHGFVYSRVVHHAKQFLWCGISGSIGTAQFGMPAGCAMNVNINDHGASPHDGVMIFLAMEKRSKKKQ